jgi:dienelactone hydrolase
VLDATVRALRRANAGRERFGIPLEGRLDLSRLALVGHSRGGTQIVRWASAGRTAQVTSLLLLEPTFDSADPPTLPDVPVTVVMGSCDGDVGTQGSRYYARATADRSRRAPAFKLVLAGANHVFFNSTWSALGRDDGASVQKPSCTRGRLTASQQRSWLVPIAADVFEQARGTRTAAWMRRGSPFPKSLYRRAVSVDRRYVRR